MEFTVELVVSVVFLLVDELEMLVVFSFDVEFKTSFVVSFVDEFVIVDVDCCTVKLVVFAACWVSLVAYIPHELNKAILNMISIAKNNFFVILPPPYPKVTPAEFHNLRICFLKV